MIKYVLRGIRSILQGSVLVEVDIGQAIGARCFPLKDCSRLS